MEWFGVEGTSRILLPWAGTHSQELRLLPASSNLSLKTSGRGQGGGDHFPSHLELNFFPLQHPNRFGFGFFCREREMFEEEILERKRQSKLLAADRA